MSSINTLKKRLVLFNFLVMVIYALSVAKGLKNPSIVDAVLLLALPITTYVILKKLLETS